MRDPDGQFQGYFMMLLQRVGMGKAPDDDMKEEHTINVFCTFDFFGRQQWKFVKYVGKLSGM